MIPAQEIARRLTDPSDPIYFAVRQTVKSVGSDDGIVILDLDSGKYYSFNGLGAQIWQAVTKNRSIQDILKTLTDLYDAPPDQIEEDLLGILNQWLGLGLVTANPQPSPDQPETAPPVVGLHPAAYPSRERASEARASGPVGAWLELVWLVRAFRALWLVDRLTQSRQFPGIQQLLEETADASAPSHRSEEAAAELHRIIDAVDRAATLYLKRRWCLQRSAACAYLLRKSGFPVNLVLGAQVIPFVAHAWVELDGEVINDTKALTETFAVLHRI